MIQDAIRARIDQFTRELEDLVRQAAIESVTSALGGGSPARMQMSAPKTAPKSVPKSVAPPAASPAGRVSFKRVAGAKRSPEQLAAIDAAILAAVSASPGNGIEVIAKSLGVPTGDLSLRVAGLLKARKVKKTGQKRATKYFPV